MFFLEKRKKIFKNKIKALRLKNNLPPNNFCEILGINQSHLKLLEEGIISPSFQILNKINKYFDIPLRSIVNTPPPAGEIKYNFSFPESQLDAEFVRQIKKIKSFLTDLKNKFYHIPGKGVENQKVNKELGLISPVFDDFFLRMLDFFNSILTNKEYKKHRAFYQRELSPFIPLSELNYYIYTKPLGYPGDFIMMNYLYEDDFVGANMFEKLIHRYTCNQPVAQANKNRKNYFKKWIKKIVAGTKNKTKITSFACGPAVDIIEFLDENEVPENLEITCIDYEKLALKQVAENIKNIKENSSKKIKIKFLCKDIINSVRKKIIPNFLKPQNLIIVAGLIDYFGQQFSSNLIKSLFECLAENGILVVGNVSEENKSQAYYDILGEWHLNLRNKEKMLALAKDISGAKNISVEEEPTTRMNLFLIIQK